jgi:hypothetical protein
MHRTIKQHKAILMGAPSPALVDLWLARAFNTHDVEAAAALYHPDASVVRLAQVHGSTVVARGAEGIRETMAGYIGIKPHMDVVGTIRRCRATLPYAGRSGRSRARTRTVQCPRTFYTDLDDLICKTR